MTVRLVVLCCAVLLAGCAIGVDGGTGTETATVVAVVDGDTVEVRYPDGETETVRLLGVDTPEVHVPVQPGEFGVPDTAAGRDCLRTWGERASAFARERLLGREVRVVVDPLVDRRDRYGRLLAYLESGGNRSFNYRLLERGYARLYESSFERRDRFGAAAAAAREASRGLWTCRTPERSLAPPAPVAAPSAEAGAPRLVTPGQSGSARVGLDRTAPVGRPPSRQH